MASREHTTFRDLLDNVVETRDGVPLGRVADLVAEWQPNGELRLTALAFGPQALARRLSDRLEPLVRAVLRDRFEHEIPISEVEEGGVVVRLRGTSSQYEVGRRSERWIAHHVLRRLSWFRY